MRRRRLLALATVSGLLLSMGLMVTPVSAGAPTEIGVTPPWRDLPHCPADPTDRAFWTVGLSGGTTGLYHVTVYFGDGSPGYSQDGPTSMDVHHDFACRSNRDFLQQWSASRSGGGTAHTTSAIHAD